MAVNSYELVFVVRPDVATDQVEKVTAKIADLVKKASGKTIKTENWGLRTLAYRINKHRKGYYVMLGVSMDGSHVAEVERNLRINEDVIRFLTIKVDELSKEPSIMMRPKKTFTPRAEA